MFFFLYISIKHGRFPLTELQEKLPNLCENMRQKCAISSDSYFVSKISSFPSILYVDKQN